MRLHFYFLAILLMVILSCSGKSPVLPKADQVPDVTNINESNSVSQVLWGIWKVTIDPDTLTTEIVPIRGPAFTANVTQFMQPPSSPIHMVSFTIGPGSDPLNGYFEVEVTMSHPFPGVNQYNGFDVKGILMGDGSIIGDHDSSVLRAGPDDTRLLNADGLTRWWNWPEFTDYGSIFGFTTGKLGPPNQPSATVNPFKYFAEGLDPDDTVTDLDPSTRGFFPSTVGSLTRSYDIQFRMNGDQIVYDFQYAVCANWEDPDPSYSPDYPQEAFTLSANCQEAYTLSVSDAGSTAYYFDNSNNGGELVLDIEIYDWQAMDDPGGVPDEVAGLWLEGDILNTPVDVLSSAVILPGSTSVSSIYEVTIGSLNLTQSGTESLFCTVENSSPNSYEPQIPGGDVYSFPDEPLAAYFTFDVTIGDETPIVYPTVQTIDPDWGFEDHIYTDVLVKGLDFDPACTLTIEHTPGDDLDISNFTFVDTSNLTFNINTKDATLGFYDVIVTNPYSAQDSLEDGFEVKEFTTWPTVQRTLGNTGSTVHTGPSGYHSSPNWTSDFDPDWNVLYPLLNDDFAFICHVGGPSYYGEVAAVDLSDGSTAWTQAFNFSPYAELTVKALSLDGSIVLCHQDPTNTIYGLDASDGSMIWSMVNVNIAIDAYATVDHDGNFIIPNRNIGILSVDSATGSENWNTTDGDPGYVTPAVGSDGTIYAVVNWAVRRLRAYDPETGNDKWSSPPSVPYATGAVTAHPNGSVLVWTQNSLICHRDDGSYSTFLWYQNYPMAWYGSVAVAPNWDIYLVGNDNILRRVDPDDGLTIDSIGGIEDYGSHPAIDTDGRIYHASENVFRVFNPDCTQIWSWSVSIYSGFKGPVIGTDGWVYAVDSGGYGPGGGLHAWHD